MPTTTCAVVAAFLGADVGAAYACSGYADPAADPHGLIEVCDVSGELVATIDGAYEGATGILFNDTLPFTLFNAGTIDVADGATALSLTAPRLTYDGTGAFIRSAMGIGMEVRTGGPVTLTTSDFIKAYRGIDVGTSAPSDPQHVAIRLEHGAEIVADQVGIAVIVADTVSIFIDRTSSVTAAGAPLPTAITLQGSETSVILAGAILGHDQTTQLLGASSRFELHPDFVFEGRLEAYGTDNTLVFGGAGSDTFDLTQLGDAYTGFNHFTKSGPSAWTLTGEAAQQFDLDIETGKVIFGEGSSVDDLEVWGTLSPSGTLYAGDVIFHQDSMLEIATTPTEASQLRVDSAVLGGATVHVIPSAGSLGDYEILLSQTPLGDGDHFDNDVSVTTTTPRYLAALRYDANKVILNLQQSGVTFSSYARTPRQAAVAALLDALGPQAPYYAQLDVMAPEAAADLLEQMSGSEFAATTGALLQNTASLSTASLARMQQQAGALGSGPPVMGYAAFSTEQWTDGLYPSVWGRLIAGTSNFGNFTSGSAALIGGADVELGEDLTLGLLAGMGSSAIVSGNTTTSSVDLSAGFYGAREFGDAVVRFGASLTHHNVGSKRVVSAPGVSETLTASYGAATVQAFAELAREFDLGAFGFELFGNLAYARHFSPRFTETGGAGALTVAASTSDALDVTLGVRATHQAALGDRLLTTGVTAGWKQRFSATPSTINSLSGSAPFEVAGISTAGSALVAGLDMRFDLDATSGLELAYNLEWSGSGTAHSISARYAKTF